MPLLISLWWVGYKARKAGDLLHCKTPFQEHGGWELAKALFWQLDVVGIILTICVFGFILVPLTIANGPHAAWSSSKILAPLIIGVFCVPIWVKWETIAPHPMVPFYVSLSSISHCKLLTALQLLKDRAVWGALAIAFFLMFCKYWTVTVIFQQTKYL